MKLNIDYNDLNFHTTEDELEIPDILVFSHLRWEFVKQRPQHIMERLGKDQQILFVEEPIPFNSNDKNTAKLIRVNKNITVLQPKVEPNDFKQISKLVNQFSELRSEQPIMWFYSPSFMPILNYLDYSLIVYDCMDELSAFKFAPVELINHEKELLSIADVVFTGGKSLYESKQQYNKNTYCFPSSVDYRHFQKVFSLTATPKDVSSLKKPIVGFYGVIDERIDLSLLKQVAKVTPEADFVMIGPVVKISEQDLPRGKNLHYLGPKNYNDLPSYLKAFKIAMMPFALNKSTKFISPTKTLEYMAALKPIISTPILDVKRDYQNEVLIVNTSSEFKKAIKYYLKEPSHAKLSRQIRQQGVIKKTSWDRTVSSMKYIITEAFSKNQYIGAMDSASA